MRKIYQFLKQLHEKVKTFSKHDTLFANFSELVIFLPTDGFRKKVEICVVY